MEIIEINKQDNGDIFITSNQSRIGLWKISNKHFIQKMQTYNLLDKSGVYVLYDDLLFNDPKKTIYCGETDRSSKRFQEHFKNKPWIQTIIFVYSTNSEKDIDKDSLKFYENKILYLIEEKGLKVSNKNKSFIKSKKFPYIKEQRLKTEFSHIKDFLIYAEPFLFNNEINLANEDIVDLQNDDLNVPIYILDDNKKFIKAFFNKKNFEITILKDQTFQLRIKNHYLNSAQKIFNIKAFEFNKVSAQDNIYKVKIISNITFKSPSTAANVIRGQQTNGWDHWKLSNKPNNNKTINKYRDA